MKPYLVEKQSTDSTGFYLMYDKGNPLRGLLIALAIEAAGVIAVFGLAWLLTCAWLLI
jgi:hypothetical protein